ncbi:hypothetical protein EFJ49_05625, partial [Escherichia coli]|uniref:hypothetical protein n=1 Tax=Escherichia coli TaxID=562 RepID=UPI001F495261
DKPHQSLPSLIQKAKYTAALSWRHDLNVIIELITPYFFFVFTDNGSVPTYRNAGEMSEHMKENK